MRVLGKAWRQWCLRLNIANRAFALRQAQPLARRYAAESIKIRFYPKKAGKSRSFRPRPLLTIYLRSRRPKGADMLTVAGD
jgi:hypothetical protein